MPLTDETEIDAMDICAQVTMAYSLVAFTLAAKQREIEQATTVAAVNIINWA